MHDAEGKPPSGAAGTGRRAELDGMRGLAMAGVLGIHANNLLPGGHLGVSLFFVLSGHLITTLLLAQFRATGRVDLRRFSLLRAARLLPALALVLAVSGATLAAFGEPSHTVALGIGASALFGANLVTAYADSGAMQLFTWAWTLSQEEQFYLLWPALLAAALRRRRVTLLAAAAVLLSLTAEVLRCVLPFGTPQQWARIYTGPDTRMDGLLIGCLLALALARRPLPPRPRWAPALAFGSLAVITAGYVAGGLGSRVTYSLWIGAVQLAAAALILAVTADRTGRPARLLAARPLAHAGRISYGLYLWNVPVHLAVQHVLHGAVPVWVNGLAWLGATLFLAETSHRLLEQPVLTRVRTSTRGPAPRRDVLLPTAP
ncbi:acyltransferase family protein [Streptomyces sp. NPDC052040]|uniref:acyltransferase family protein n=1 Tax=unclassified Streptomyces TaxID=2593676 RepID=UPI0037CFA75C